MKQLTLKLVRSIAAGLLIGLGGTVFLFLAKDGNKILGSFMFTLGLFFICVYQYNLYTGMAGNAYENSWKINVQLLLVLVGNFIGTGLVALLLHFTRAGDGLRNQAYLLIEIKLNDNLWSIFILAIFCGILMFLAVNTYRKAENHLQKIVALFVCVAGFIICGFEHCIANMYYFSMANSWTWKALLYLIVMIIGNFFGCLAFPTINLIISYLQKEPKDIEKENK